MKTEQEDRPAKIDEKEKLGAKRAMKQRLHEYASGVDAKPVSIVEQNIPCSKCGAMPCTPGRPGVWYCRDHR